MAEKIEEESLVEEELENTSEDDIVTEEPSDEPDREKLEKLTRKLRKKEIRSVLLGNLSINEDGITVAGKNHIITPYGLEDGAQAVAFLGIKKKRYIYCTTLKSFTQVKYRVLKVMSDIGRVFVMESAPEALACRVKGYVFRPVVLVFEEVAVGDESVLQLTAYCGRSPLVIIPILHAVSRFNKLLPKEITRFKKKKTKADKNIKSK